VLIVEDKVEMMMMYRSYLKNSGFHLLPASTIREAREVLERILPKAIVLDVVLRAEDSWRLLVELKQDVRTRAIPVMIASTIEDQAKAYHLGADEYILKPVERAQLLERLKGLTAEARPTRVLIIDDDERDRYFLKQLLRESDVTIQETTSGAEGIHAAAKEGPDAIILDLTMPGMSGFEVLDALKSNVSTKDIPVIICTSRVLPEPERLQLLGKAAAILPKEGPGCEDIAEVIRRAVRPVRLSAAVI
jgi:CheY-like chemotaxis protein